MANSKRKCRYCGAYKNFGEMVKVPLGYFCSYDHAALHGIAKQNKEKLKLKRADTRLRKEALKTRPQLVEEAEAAVRAYIRVRDHGKPCISCGALPNNDGLITGSKIDAGHYRSKGAAKHLRFNLYNIHAQCVRCNRDLSGNGVEYRKGLIERIGLDKVERLELDNTVRRWDKEYLRRLKKVFNKRTRHLKKLRGLE